MLTLLRKRGESVRIGEDIEIFVTEVKGDKVRLDISAPENIKISRAELHLTMENNREASDKVDLPEIFQLSRNLYQADQEHKQEGRHGNG